MLDTVRITPPHWRLIGVTVHYARNLTPINIPKNTHLSEAYTRSRRYPMHIHYLTIN